MILEVEEINAILCNFVQSYQHLISQCRYWTISIQKKLKKLKIKVSWLFPFENKESFFRCTSSLHKYIRK